MILYNITTIIETEINAQWLRWANEEYIPAIMATELFASNRMLKVLDSPNEGITYCIQFVADDLGKFNKFLDTFGEIHERKQQELFPEKFISFSTVMEYID
jgi:hypothetical protein